MLVYFYTVLNMDLFVENEFDATLSKMRFYFECCRDVALVENFVFTAVSLGYRNVDYVGSVKNTNEYRVVFLYFYFFMYTIAVAFVFLNLEPQVYVGMYADGAIEALFLRGPRGPTLWGARQGAFVQDHFMCCLRHSLP